MNGYRVIGLTFNHEVAKHIDNRLAEAGLDTVTEGTSASGYWIACPIGDAHRAIKSITTDFRYQSGDLNLSIVTPSELKQRNPPEIHEVLLSRLPSEEYRRLDYDRLGRADDERHGA